MNISRSLIGSLLIYSAPVFAQSQPRTTDNIPFPLVTPEVALQLVAPKPISLQLKDVTAETALKDLARQSNISLIFHGEESLSKKISVSIKTRSFYEASQTIVKATGFAGPISLRDTYTPRVFEFNLFPSFIKPTLSSYDQDFDLTLTRLANSTYKTIWASTNDERIEENDLSLSFYYNIDPRLTLLGPPKIYITKAVDDTGKSLLRDTDKRDFFTFADYKPDSPESRGLTAKVDTPSLESKNLAALEGKVLYIIPTEYQRWEAKNLLEQKVFSREFRCGNQRIRIDLSHVVLSKDNLKLRLEVDSPDLSPKSAKAFFPISILRLVDDIQFKDGRGTRITPTKYDWRWTMVNGKAMIQANFAIKKTTQKGAISRTTLQKIHKPVSFSVDLPTDVVQTEVPFSSSAVPLP